MFAYRTLHGFPSKLSNNRDLPSYLSMSQKFRTVIGFSHSLAVFCVPSCHLYIDYLSLDESLGAQSTNHAQPDKAQRRLSWPTWTNPDTLEPLVPSDQAACRSPAAETPVPPLRAAGPSSAGGLPRPPKRTA